MGFPADQWAKKKEGPFIRVNAKRRIWQNPLTRKFHPSNKYVLRFGDIMLKVDKSFAFYPLVTSTLILTPYLHFEQLDG